MTKKELVLLRSACWVILGVCVALMIEQPDWMWRLAPIAVGSVFGATIVHLQARINELRRHEGEVREGDGFLLHALVGAIGISGIWLAIAELEYYKIPVNDWVIATQAVASGCTFIWILTWLQRVRSSKWPAYRIIEICASGFAAGSVPVIMHESTATPGGWAALITSVVIVIECQLSHEEESQLDMLQITATVLAAPLLTLGLLLHSEPWDIVLLGAGAIVFTGDLWAIGYMVYFQRSPEKLKRYRSWCNHTPIDYDRRDGWYELTPVGQMALTRAITSSLLVGSVLWRVLVVGREVQILWSVAAAAFLMSTVIISMEMRRQLKKGILTVIEGGQKKHA